VIIGDWDFVDFLSKDGYFFDKLRIVRKYDRVLHKQNMDYGNTEPTTNK
jgi:hypothetical protein